MKAKWVAGLLVAGFACGVSVAAPNWLLEFMMVRAPQTQVVRDPNFPNRYYLCWTDGTSRYGIYFRRGVLDQNLKSLPTGSRRTLSSMLTINENGWSERDRQVCWGK